MNRPDLLRRRELLGLAALPLAAALRPRSARADDHPPVPVTDPKAIDGDSRFGPDWEERLTLTVGPDKADLVGLDDTAIQAALDYVARLGGGTVRLLPGHFVLRNAVFLPSGVRIVGSGEDSVVTKVPSVTVPLADDSDWYDGEITLADSSGFQVGDGVVLRAKNPDNGSNIVIKRTLVARSGNRFKLDRGLRENLWLSGTPTCSSLFPLLTAEHATDVVIEDLALDGDKANNEHLDGNYAGCIFLQDCNRFTIRRVTARNNNGDGISFQICHDVRVEDCQSLDNADLGLHPGSGSQRPVLLNNRLEGNTIGLFWCWGVRFGLAEGNRIVGNRGSGVSIGHRDTDNVIRNNEIVDSGQVGILFRDDARGQDFWPNRNRVESNRVVNSGGEDGIAIDIQGRPRDVSLLGNEILETRSPASRIGIRIGEAAGAVEESGNRIEGFDTSVLDLRSGG
jgi:hypothetical protein